jgi:MoaA/NifB/PqqE/SkfB family radical SAM enzyme
MKVFPLKYSFAKFRNSIFFDDFNSSILKLDKAYPPSYVIWDSTRRCNLACEHCGASKEKYTKELTTEQIKSFVKQLAEFKVKFFAVTGGEPLVRKDLFEILSFANGLGIRTGIATNGFLIDEQIAKKIKKSNVSSIQISIDGLEETHNKIRGNKQSFQKAMGAIDLLKEINIPILSVASTITPHNLQELDGLRDTLTSKGISMWRLGVVMPIGRAESNDLLLDSSQLKFLLDWIVANNSKNYRSKCAKT